MSEHLAIARTDETTHGTYRIELAGADRPAVPANLPATSDYL